jgi:hypothetical protein
MAYRSACRRASGPVKISNSHRPSQSNRSTHHWPGVSFTFESITQAMACRLEFEAVVRRAKSLIDGNGNIRA